MYTTGILVDDKISKKLSNYKNLYEIHVSLDGGRELHDSLRGEGSYEKTIKGIKYNRDKIKVASILRHGIVEEIIHSVVKIIRELGIPLDRLELGYIIPVGKGESMKDQVLTMPEFVDGLELAMKYGITHTDLSKWKDEIEYYGKEEFMSFSHKLGVGAGNCGTCYISVAITPNGDVHPCAIMVSYPQFKMGNIFEDSMEKIFKKEAERWVFRKTPSIDTCGNCKYLTYCNKCFGFEIAFCKHPGWLLYDRK